MDPSTYTALSGCRNPLATTSHCPNHLTLDLPGVKPENTNVQVLEGHTLSVEAERTVGRATKTSRKFVLHPSVDVSAIQASMEDGILKVTLPKTKEPQSNVMVEETVDVARTEEGGGNDGTKPNVNNEAVASVDLPGVKLADITVQRRTDTVTIQACRQREGRVVAQFVRKFVFDPKKIRGEEMKGYFTNGVLRLVAPYRDEVPPISIPVGVVGSDVKSSFQRAPAQASKTEYE